MYTSNPQLGKNYIMHMSSQMEFELGNNFDHHI